MEIQRCRSRVLPFRPTPTSPLFQCCRKLAIITARVLVETSIFPARTAESWQRQTSAAATNPTMREEQQHFFASRRSTIASSGATSVKKTRNSGTATATKSTAHPEEGCVSGDQVLRKMGGGYLVVATLHTLSRVIPVTTAIESLSLQLAGMQREDRGRITAHCSRTSDSDKRRLRLKQIAERSWLCGSAS